MSHWKYLLSMVLNIFPHYLNCLNFIAGNVLGLIIVHEFDLCEGVLFLQNDIIDTSEQGLLTYNCLDVFG